MTNFSPALAGMLFENPTITETCRITVENVVNELLKTELTEFLDYEKHDPIGYNSGDSRNGFYPHKVQTFLGEIAAQIPRDRNGDFKNHTIPSYKHSDQSLEAMVIQLYKKGITTREISSLIEQMYGHHYSPQTISHITLAVEDQAKAFHSRSIEKHYAVIYCDATFINLRRDTVAKEALHVMIGVTPGGDKEILDYAL